MDRSSCAAEDEERYWSVPVSYTHLDVYKRQVDAPEIVAIQFFAGGLLKRHHICSLWVQSAHDVLNAAVFSGSIHCLKNKNESLFILGIQFLLQGKHSFLIDFKLFPSFFFCPVLMLVRIVLGLSLIHILQRRPLQALLLWTMRHKR